MLRILSEFRIFSTWVMDFQMNSKACIKLFVGASLLWYRSNSELYYETPESIQTRYIHSIYIYIYIKRDEKIGVQLIINVYKHRWTPYASCFSNICFYQIWSEASTLLFGLRIHNPWTNISNIIRTRILFWEFQNSLIESINLQSLKWTRVPFTICSTFISSISETIRFERRASHAMTLVFKCWGSAHIW